MGIDQAPLVLAATLHRAGGSLELLVVAAASTRATAQHFVRADHHGISLKWAPEGLLLLLLLVSHSRSARRCRLQLVTAMRAVGAVSSDD